MSSSVPSIQASRSPSSGAQSAPQDYRTQVAGPLQISITAPKGPLLDLIDATLELFDVQWQLTATRQVTLDVQVTESAVEKAAGRYLQAARMKVDPIPDGLRATTDGGASMVGRFEPTEERWLMSVPPAIVSAGQWIDVEDLLSLLLTTGWRRAGWIPLHAAGVIEPGTVTPRQMLVCAASGGGKTTFTLGLVRRGWRSLGDDKLLVGDAGDGSIVAAIKQMLNVDPAIAGWFPELAQVGSLPAYSTWTPKRRVSLAMLWPHAPAATMQPTHLVVLNRVPGRGGVRVTALDRAESISALLRQTVIPRDPVVARPITRAIAQLGERLAGARLDLFEDAFEDEATLELALGQLA